MMRPLLVLCLLASAAYADKTASLTHYEKGKQAYAAGKFELAVTEFERAYADWNAVEYLHDIGQAYRRLGRCNEAATALERYLDGKPDAPNRVTVAGHIQALRAKCPAAPPVSTPAVVQEPAPQATPLPTPATPHVAPVLEPRPEPTASTSVVKNAPLQRAPSPWHPTARAGIVLLDAGPVVMPPLVEVGAGVLRDIRLPHSFQLGASLTATRLPYDDQMSGTVWLVGPEAIAAASHPIASRITATGGIALGAQLVSGLGEGNPFTTNGAEHGSFVMLRLRGELGVAWRANDRVTVRIAPLGYQFSPRRAPLATDIRALHGFSAHAGVSVDL